MALASCRPNILVRTPEGFSSHTQEDITRALTLASTVQKVSTLHLIVGLNLGGRHRLATVSTIGTVSLDSGRRGPYILYIVRIDVDELLRDRELSSQPTTKADTSPRKRKSDENDTPTLMKKRRSRHRLDHVT